MVFASLAGLQLLVSMPYLLNIHVAHHDTLFVFHVFAFYYNEAFVHGTLPQWIPFGFLGVQSDYLPAHLSPANYLAGIAGLVFRVEHMYALFKASLLIEQMILLAGLYLLATEIFKRRVTVFLVCLSAIGGLFPMFQILWGLRALYLLPLIIFLILRGLTTRRLLYLSAGLAVFTATLPGTVYYLPAHMLTLAVIVLVLGVGNHAGFWRKWRDFFVMSRRDWLWNALLIAIAVVMGLSFRVLIQGMEQEVIVLAEGRDARSGATSLEAFLTYGPGIGFEKFRGLFDPTRYSDLQLNIFLYTGILSLPLAAFGFFRRLRLVQLAFLAAVLVLGVASLGATTPVAELLYDYFPLMKYYRHIGFLVCSYAIFIPLLAGFGLDRALDLVNQRKDATGNSPMTGVHRTPPAIRALALLIYICIACALYFHFRMWFMLLSDYQDLIQQQQRAISYASGVFVLFYGVLCWRFGWNAVPARDLNVKRWSSGLIVLVFIDLASLQIHRSMEIAPHERGLAELLNGPAARVATYSFQPQRTLTPPHARAQDIKQYRGFGVTYAVVYNWMQWDPVMPLGDEVVAGHPPRGHYRVDFINTHVHRIIEAFGGHISTWEREIPDERVHAIMGWETDKLKLFTHAVTVTDDHDTIARLKQSPAPMLVLLAPDGNAPAATPGDEHVPADIEVIDYQANRIVLRCEAPGDRPSWLYYAEAWHPDWRARVNGKPTPILRANYAFKAVSLEEGENIVEMVFDHPARRWAAHTLAFMGAGFILVVGATFARLSRRDAACEDHRQ